MPTTSNFGWTTPADTDLVKDGAAAIRTLGNGIDTSFLDLKGGTTGQILSKASNTDLDYAWITNDVGDITEVAAGTGISGGGTSGSVTITNSMATAIDAKGDLVAGTGADAFARLAVGANDTILTADSSTATGLKWATLSASSYTQLASGSLPTNAATLTLSSISQSYRDLVLVIRSFRPATGGSELTCKPNNQSSFWVVNGVSVAGGNATDTYLQLSGPTETTATKGHAVLQIFDYASTVGRTVGQVNFGSSNNVSGQNRGFYGFYIASDAIDNIVINCTGGGNFSDGTYELFGVK